MKRLLLLAIALVPMLTMAQTNDWEIPDENAPKAAQAPKETAEKEEKPQVDPKYLAGAVPEVDGKVVFERTFEVPGLTATAAFERMRSLMQRMTLAKNQLQSQVVFADSTEHVVAGSYQEWLEFSRSFISLDRTRFNYHLIAECSDGKVVVRMQRISYLYDEARNPQHYTAEEWITDKQGLNKKQTKLARISGKFRRKTIDRKDFIFEQIEKELKK